MLTGFDDKIFSFLGIAAGRQDRAQALGGDFHRLSLVCLFLRHDGFQNISVQRSGLELLVHMPRL
jgi:hypothetical protein